MYDYCGKAVLQGFNAFYTEGCTVAWQSTLVQRYIGTGKGKMRVASCESASGYFASSSASQMCEYLGKVRDRRICELPTERLKSAA